MRPRLVGEALREIGRDPDVVDALFGVLETQEILAGNGEIVLMPTGGGLHSALESVRDSPRTPPASGS